MTRYIILPLAAAATTPIWAGTPTSQFVEGTFATSCAPYDGPAFTMSLQSKARTDRYIIHINAPLSEAERKWAIGSTGSDHAASISVCDQGKTPRCSFANRGTIQITKSTPALMTGKIDVSIQRAAASAETLKMGFSAKLDLASNPRMFCG